MEKSGLCHWAVWGRAALGGLERLFAFWGAAAEGAVSLGGGSLGAALGATAKLAEPRGHPLLRAEETLEERGEIKVGIQFWEMNAETRGRDFDVAELCGRGVVQALSKTRRKANVQVGTELNDDAAACAVVAGGDGPGKRLAERCGAPICQGESVMRGHEFAPTRGKAE